MVIALSPPRASAAAPPSPELVHLIRDRGVLWSARDRPIRSRDGTNAEWMLYTYPITLTADGGRIVAEHLLPVLRTFTARQLVSVGYTAIPVLAATVQHSAGEFVGACIRETRKAYGSGRRIEGALDRSRPVVVIDDSISSGKSIKTAIAALEDEGYEVEGAVALVRFPWRGGVEWARGNGYRIETVLDIWADVGMPLATHTHGHACVQPRWSARRAPSGQHPAVVARAVAAEMLRGGTALIPPAHFDGDYDGRGGVYVSFRDRDTDVRIARAGFWHFNPDDADATRDVVLATVKTVNLARAQLAAHGLDRLKIAVSFLGPLRPVAPSELDFDRLGLVARSAVQPGKVGGALPHTEVFTSEIEQYRHAVYRNARLGLTEPEELFVHSVAKYPEPGCYWLPYGSSDDAQEVLPDEVGQALTRRAVAALEAHRTKSPLTGPALADDLVPDPVFGVAVTLYARGVLGCCVSAGSSLDESVVRATRVAADDPRFAARRAAAGEHIDVCVSVLRDRELLGTTADLGRALVKARPGEDSVGVSDGPRHALFLPQVSVHENWSRAELARQLLRKAKIDGGATAWTAYRTSSWLRRGSRTYPLRGAFPARPTPTTDLDTVRATLGRLSDYLLGQITSEGIPAYCYDPVFGRTTTTGTAGRVLHALTAMAEAGHVLQRADLVQAAARGLDVALRTIDPTEPGLAVRLPGLSSSTGADAELVLGLVAVGQRGLDDVRTAHAYERLLRTVQPDGRVDPAIRLSARAEHDFLPGLVFLALASHPDRMPDLGPSLGWYRRRFAQLAPWGMVGWHPQAWQAVWAAGERAAEIPAFVGEMLDWALARQLRKTGAFLTDLNLTGPSFHTAFVMEGVADAARLMLSCGEPEIAEKYMRAWRRGFAFLDRLIIDEADTYCLHDPSAATGGVRGTLTSTTVRVDFVSHAALALVKALQYADAINQREVQS